jgi:hypothetical protein
LTREARRREFCSTCNELQVDVVVAFLCWKLTVTSSCRTLFCTFYTFTFYLLFTPSTQSFVTTTTATINIILARNVTDEGIDEWMIENGSEASL